MMGGTGRGRGLNPNCNTELIPHLNIINVVSKMLLIVLCLSPTSPIGLQAVYVERHLPSIDVPRASLQIMEQVRAPSRLRAFHLRALHI